MVGSAIPMTTAAPAAQPAVPVTTIISLLSRRLGNIIAVRRSQSCVSRHRKKDVDIGPLVLFSPP